MDLYFKVTHTNIEMVDKINPVADSNNYIKLHFEFLTDEWSDGEKTVYIGNYPILLSDTNICNLPMLPRGSYSVGVGVVKSDETIIYTNKVVMHLTESTKPISNEELIPPDVYEQIMGRIDEIANVDVTEQVETIIKDYLEKNPPKGEIDVVELQAIVKQYLDENLPECETLTKEQVEDIVADYLAKNPPSGGETGSADELVDLLLKLAVKGEYEGKNTTLTDTFEWEVQNFSLQGISEQDGTPTPTNPLPIINAGVYNPDKDAYEITIKFTNTEEQGQEIILTTKKQLCKWDKLVKKDGKWYWEYRTYQMEFDGSERWLVYDTYKGFSGVLVLPEGGYRNDGVCNQYKPTLIPTWDKNSMWIGTAGVKYLYCINADFYDASLEDKGLANFKAHLSKNHLIVQSYLTTPTLVELDLETQEKLNSLKTYYPTTVIENDQSCPMTLRYIADTTNYINNKFTNIKSTLGLDELMSTLEENTELGEIE